MREYQNIKIFSQMAMYIPNWTEEVFLITKVKRYYVFDVCY